MDDSGSIGRIANQIQLAAGMTGQGTQASWIPDVLLILILILINGFFSASEMAIVSLNDNKVRKMAEEGSPTANRLLRFINDQGNFLATIQVGVTLAGFLSSAFASEKFASRLYLVLDANGRFPALQTIATILITILISYFSLVLGELVPKRIAISNPERFSHRFVGLLWVIDRILSPVTRFLNFSANLVLKLLRVESRAAKDRVTEEEIRMMVEVGRDSGDIHVEEVALINNIFAFNDKDVSEIMTPRTSVIAIPVTTGYAEAFDIVTNERFSRYPVYERDLDTIVGVLHLKDLLRVPQDQRGDQFDLARIVREPYFVPEGKAIDVLFREMQGNQVSLAIVVDEYGGVDGIVSIEDLMEEIVGDISDEYDEMSDDIVLEGEQVYSINGRITPFEAGAVIPELNELEDDDDYDTLAGFVLSLLGYIPDPDDHPSVTFQNLRFTVTEMDDKRIARIRLEILPESVETNTEEKP